MHEEGGMGINYQHRIFGLLTSDAGDYRVQTINVPFLVNPYQLKFL